MKKILFLIAVVNIAFAFRAGNDPLPIGAAAPKTAVKMKDVSGKQVSLDETKKVKGLLVIFSCNTCPYVLKNKERATAICKYAQGKEIGVIVLNANEKSRGKSDSYEAMQQYAKDAGYEWPYVVDSNSELANAFGAARTPECFLFNGEGRLVYHGAIDDSPADAAKVSREHLKQAIDETLNGTEVSVKTSRSVGCSIAR